MEDEIDNICKTFSIQNKKQEQNLIETLKQNCRKIVKDRTGKRPYTTINISRV
jgi:ribonuclease J